MTGSSAAKDLGLVAPDTVDAYLPADRLDEIIAEHGLQEARSAGEDNVILRAVPDGAWHLTGRESAPVAAIALDLSFYLDSRSARAGHELLAKLDRGLRPE